MADSKRKRGKADRRKVARLQPHEYRYVARKFGVKSAIVRFVIWCVGNDRKKVERMLNHYVALRL